MLDKYHFGGLHKNSPYDLFSYYLPFSSSPVFLYFWHIPLWWTCTLILVPVSDDLLGQIPRCRHIGSQAMRIYFQGSGWGETRWLFQEGDAALRSPAGFAKTISLCLTSILVGLMFICKSHQPWPCLWLGASGDERWPLWPVTFPERMRVPGFFCSWRRQHAVPGISQLWEAQEL